MEFMLFIRSETTLIPNAGILRNCLFFHSKKVEIYLQKIILIGIGRNQIFYCIFGQWNVFWCTHKNKQEASEICWNVKKSMTVKQGTY